MTYNLRADSAAMESIARTADYMGVDPVIVGVEAGNGLPAYWRIGMGPRDLILPDNAAVAYAMITGYEAGVRQAMQLLLTRQIEDGAKRFNKRLGEVGR